MFDLAIALGMLAASRQLDPARLASATVLGELALDGGVRPVRGTLPIARALRRGHRRLLLPADNAPEASLVRGVQVIPVRSLREAVDALSGSLPLPGPWIRHRAPGRAISQPRYDVDFADVQGQAHAKRAFEVAVAGHHHILLIGPPGSGKTMLAQRLPTILPPLTLPEALETTAIHSVAGLLDHGVERDSEPVLWHRPFRAPHHTSSAVSLIGGGHAIPAPGEISLAHHGVLFLDELPEFHRDVLESLRQPLEEGVVTIARAKRTLRFPARCLLVAAMNPCPCGHLTDPGRSCRCPSTKVAAYLAKISGPLLDRIDLHVDVPAVPLEALIRDGRSEPSAAIRARVLQAHRRSRRRLRRLGLAHNAQLRSRDLRAACPMTGAAASLLTRAMRELRLSARSYEKILKIARTIADLTGEDVLEPAHIAEATQYRALDRQLWR